MNGPRLTEERLRLSLDSNQVMRERMCLALLPLLGPYSREQPRRPKGGPDQGRDIEALHQGTTVVWGAVGFKNGGGNDDGTRDEIEKKFKDDLKRALEEKPDLTGFVFFTNVDLTPTRIEGLKAHAQANGINIIDIFDLERLRHGLDSPEGLIARLQYLEIPMSLTEQLGLVSKFGTQLQNAVTARFDRVERTLAQMERFMDLQKPLFRLDIVIQLAEEATSAAIGDEAVYLKIHGLQALDRSLSCLCLNQPTHRDADKHLLLATVVWTDGHSSKTLSFIPSVGIGRVQMRSFTELNLTGVGGRVTLGELTSIGLDVYCTRDFHCRIKQIIVNANGFGMFACVPDRAEEVSDLKWPDTLPYEALCRSWVRLAKQQTRNLLFDPLQRSGLFAPLQQVE
jgi:hypothetical protein